MSVQTTIETIRRNAFEERDGNSLGCLGPTHVMLRNGEAEALADEVERLSRALSDGAKWIPVTERLPANAEHVLVVAVPYRYPYSAIRGEGHWLIDGMPDPWYDTDDDACFVSHWMPLPEAPK